MSSPGISNISNVSDERGTFQIHANGTDFFISITFFNDSGVRQVNKFEYSKLLFESIYKSPFIIGSLHLFDDDFGGLSELKFSDEPSTLLDQARAWYHAEFRALSNGGCFIRIKVDQQSAATKCDRVPLVDDVYICKSTDVVVENNQKVVCYYFANIEYASLLHQRKPWSTNDYLGQATFNAAELAMAATYNIPISQLGASGKPIKVSDAIKFLLQATSSNNSQGIINEEEWEESISEIEYTLSNNEPPLVGLNHLMSKYVSKNNKDMGILLYSGGQYSLKSLTTVLSEVSNIQKDNSGNNWINGPMFAGIIKIETDDIRTRYSAKQSHSMFDFPENTHLLIPVHVKQTQFHLKQPDSAVSYIVDHSVVSYDIGDKLFKLNNENGSVENVKKSFSQKTRAFPDEKDKEVNIEKDDITSSNKKVFFNLKTTADADEYYGKCILQQKIIDKADKVTINTMGAPTMTGGKFIGLTVGGKLKPGSFMYNVPGYWMILRNITTLEEGEFKTVLSCAKIDKFQRQSGTKKAGPS